MSALATTLATGVSLAVLGRLAATDPKRRRAFRLSSPEVRHPRLLWATALLPGVLVPFWSGAAGFFVWFGAVSIAGWVVAAVSPDRILALRARAGALADRVVASVAPALAASRGAAGRVLGAGGAVAAAAPPPAPACAELDRRLRELEAEVAVLRAAVATGERPPAAATVIELAGHRQA